jgi:hypothetical protein
MTFEAFFVDARAAGFFFSGSAAVFLGFGLATFSTVSSA